VDKPASYYIILVSALVVLLSLSAFFGLSETSFSTLSRIKLKNMAEKNKRARLALKMLDAYDKLLSSILIGNNVVNTASSALATVLFLELFGVKGISLATGIMTVLLVVFGEISPKTLAKRSPESIALKAAPLMRFFTVIFTPFNYLAGVWQRFIIKVFPSKADRSITEDELLTFVEEVRQEGGINRQEEQMIRHVIEFDDITAAEIITPRVDVAAVSEDSPSEEIDRVFAATGFSRLPVYRDTIDTIIGVILLKDFHHEVMKKGKPPAQIVKPVVFVTKTMKISSLLQTLQRKQSHMAVLVDEFGGTLGIVTMEDIVEELVGEIWDEHEKVVQQFRQNSNVSFSVLGSAKFQDMLEYIGYKIADNDGDDIPNTTVGSWILETTGSLPRAGEQITWRDLQFTVSRVQRHRVMEVIVYRKDLLQKN
jgi:CBS domain containing-hemolysin-like protein